MATNNSIKVCFWTHGNGHKTYMPDITDSQQVTSDPAFILVNTDEDGNAIPDEDWHIDDGGGNTILEGRDAIEAHTGTLDIGGNYCTYTVKDIDDCTADEWDTLYRHYINGGTIGSDVVDAILTHFNLTPVEDHDVYDVEGNDISGCVIRCTITLMGGGVSTSVEYLVRNSARTAVKNAIDEAEAFGSDPATAREHIESAIKAAWEEL